MLNSVAHPIARDLDKLPVKWEVYRFTAKPHCIINNVKIVREK